MVLIRTATADDAEAIAHVHVQSWRTTYAGIVPQSYLDGLNEAERVPLWREWLTRGVEVHVAELHGNIAGFISGGAIREPLLAYDAELFALYLLEQSQGRGIGTKLLKELAESLREKSFISMAVWVLELNSATQFYARSGAQFLHAKQIEIGGTMLSEVAYGWPDLAVIG